MNPYAAGSTAVAVEESEGRFARLPLVSAVFAALSLASVIVMIAMALVANIAPEHEPDSLHIAAVFISWIGCSIVGLLLGAIALIFQPLRRRMAWFGAGICGMCAMAFAALMLYASIR